MKKFETTFTSLIIAILMLTSSSLASEALISKPTANLPSPIAPIAGVTISLADIVEPLMPAVVNVYTSQHIKSSRTQRIPFPEGFPFDQFGGLFEQFNNPLNSEENYSNPKSTALGSGFIIDSAGFVVTNSHVINNADEIYVKLADNTELPAKLIGSDKKTDLALLKVEAKNELPFVKFGDSSKARVGDIVFAIGNPFALGGTVTSGIISSKGRDIGNDSNIDDFIQTDAAINVGNSGGPLFNMQGEVIGVNTAIFSPSGTNIGIGFAIPAVAAESIIGQLMKGGKINRGRLDVTIQQVTPEIAEGLGLKDTEGVLIAEVIPGGSGDKAGLKSGDIVLEFNGQIIKTQRKLQISVAETPVNKDVKMVILRSGKKQEITLKILDNEKDSKKLSISHKNEHSSNNSFKKNGFTFSNFTPSIKAKFDIREDIKGIVITEIPAELKSTISVKVGDIVVGINQQSVEDVAQIKKIFEDAKIQKKLNAVLLIKRRERSGMSTFIATIPLN